MDFTDHRDVTLLGIFNHRFGELMNVYIPFLHPNFEPLTFGCFIPDVTPDITSARANLKPITRAKQFPRFRIYG